MMAERVGDDTISQLLQAGYAPTTIALTLDVALDRVIELMPSEERSQIAAADDLLRDGIRFLAWRTLEEAMRVLDEGTADNKMRIISKFGPQMVTILGKEQKDEMADLRQDMQNILMEVRSSVGELETPSDETQYTE